MAFVVERPANPDPIDGFLTHLGACRTFQQKERVSDAVLFDDCIKSCDLGVWSLDRCFENCCESY